jgi:ribosome-binding factor A
LSCLAVFRQIGDLDNAVEAFKNAVSWQLMLATCQELDYSEDDLQTAAQEMADLLANLSRYREVRPTDVPRLEAVCVPFR